MNAADIAATLEARREGHSWRARCPLCGGQNLTLKDGASALLVTCWNDCDRRDVLAELRERGLITGRADYSPRVISAPRVNDTPARTARALGIWREASNADKTVSRYLASRSVMLDRWPPSLRFHPRCARPRDANGNLLSPLPAMVALIEHVEHGPIGVHCTYLKPDGAGKADAEKQKAMFGSTSGGAVRFGTPQPDQWFAVAEGIETTLSIVTACSTTAWAALSAGGIKNLILPRDATHIVICADRDRNGTGERVAHDAAERWLAEGRHVRIAVPPDLGTDFNDVLSGCVGAKNNEARHVA